MVHADHDIRILTTAAESTLFTKEFSLADRVALVTGGHRGIGLEMALALVEAGSRVVYCVVLPKKPGEEFAKVREYVSRMQGTGGDARLEYICADVTDQVSTWSLRSREWARSPLCLARC